MHIVFLFLFLGNVKGRQRRRQKTKNLYIQKQTNQISDTHIEIHEVYKINK